MENSKMIAAAVVVLVIAGGGVAWAVNSKDSDTSNSQNSSEVMEKDGDTMAKDSDTMEKDGEVMVKEDESMEKTDDAMEKDGDSMEKHDDAMEKTDETVMQKKDNYVTLASYNSDKAAYSDTSQVLFFHADWCPTCIGIEKEIKDDPSRVPADVTIIEVDYDSNKDLRKQYGVTNQSTMVQIDSNGNSIKKWNVANLDAVLNGIQS